VAMAGGRAEIAWGYGADRRRFGVQAAIGSPTAPGVRQTVASVSLTNVTSTPPAVDATIDAHGPATLVFTLPAERDPADAVAAPARRRRHLSHDPFTR
jgi:hypothetical protein